METGYLVSDAMTQNPVIVDKKISLKECALLMEKHHVGAVLIDDNGKYFIVTEKDIVRKAVAHNLSASSTPVFDIMTPMMHTISPNADVLAALERMRDKNIR